MISSCSLHSLHCIALHCRADHADTVLTAERITHSSRQQLRSHARRHGRQSRGQSLQPTRLLYIEHYIHVCIHCKRTLYMYIAQAEDLCTTNIACRPARMKHNTYYTLNHPYAHTHSCQSDLPGDLSPLSLIAASLACTGRSALHSRVHARARAHTHTARLPYTHTHIHTYAYTHTHGCMTPRRAHTSSWEHNPRTYTHARRVE